MFKPLRNKQTNTPKKLTIKQKKKPQTKLIKPKPKAAIATHCSGLWLVAKSAAASLC